MEDFLSARLNALTPPSCWPQIPQAAELLAQELLSGKKLAVWGDYDVDGITACPWMSWKPTASWPGTICPTAAARVTA